MAKCKDVSKNRCGWTDTRRDKTKEQEERRVWRVLYWHLKAMFEAADSGVIDIRNVILPYVVMADGRTISDQLVPQMARMLSVDSTRLLPAGDQ